MFLSDVLLGFLLRFLYKNYKMFAKNLSCYILLSFNYIAVELVFTNVLVWSCIYKLYVISVSKCLQVLIF